VVHPPPHLIIIFFTIVTISSTKFTYIYIFLYRKAARLTTNQITDMMEELDDSDLDPDYEEKADSEADMFDMSDEDDEEVVTMESVRRKDQPQECIWTPPWSDQTATLTRTQVE
jgi:hypothetical protein